MRIYGFNKQVEGLVNKKPTDEARMNISKTSARYWLGKKRVVTWKPHVWTKEERKAMSDRAKGRTHTEQTKAKLSEISKANQSGRIAAIEASKKKIINEKLGIVYESVNDACKKLKISTSTVYRCVNGITKNKYRLKYA
jgi:transcriptional regulator with PAS, ATPase and Fis domain